MTAWTGEDAGWRRLWGIILVPLCLFLALGLFSYDWKDIGLLQAPPNSPPANLIGPVGAWLSFGFFMLFGVGAYLAPLWCLVFGVVLFFDREERVWPRGLWLFVLMLSLVAGMELQAGAPGSVTANTGTFVTVRLIRSVTIVTSTVISLGSIW